MKLFQIFTIFLLLTPFTYAQEDSTPASVVNIDKSVNWIMQQTATTTEEASLALLAATKSAQVSNQVAIDKLLALKSEFQYCWPSKCNTKDTALALLALTKAGDAVSFDVLLKQEDPNTEGEWLLQIETQAAGTCNLNYGDKPIQIQIENSRIKSDICKFSNQFNLNKCLKSGLLSGKTSLDISITCTLGTGKISLLHEVDNKFFLVGEVSSNLFTTLHLGNSNFKDYETTLYSSWALKSAGKTPNSIIWLKRFYTPSVLSSSLMYILIEEESYINDLLALQDKNSGSFGDVYDTSLALLALRKQGINTAEINLAESWLESQMQEDFSWNKNIRDTAMVIYGAFAPLDVEIPYIPITTTPLPDQGCNENGVCETILNENNANCPDCYCGDNICDYSDLENENSCPQDCITPAFEPECFDDADCDEGELCEDEKCVEKEGKGFFFWFIIILLILAILGGAAYFYYKNFYQTGKQLLKPKTPPLFKQPQQPTYRSPQPAYKPRKTLTEKRLEESLKQAKKVFGKK